MFYRKEIILYKQKCTILLYSSKSFLTSRDWASVWSCKKHKHGGVNGWKPHEREGHKEADGERERWRLPALWCESVTGAAVWWRVLERLWMTETNSWHMCDRINLQYWSSSIPEAVQRPCKILHHWIKRMEIEINIKRHSVLYKVRENVAVSQGHVDLDKHWSNNLKTLVIRYNNTSDVVAVQQRLHVADLLQQSSLGEQEVLLCADKHKTESPWALNQM